MLQPFRGRVSVWQSKDPEASIQAALDYACGMGGLDCSQIQ